MMPFPKYMLTYCFRNGNRVVEGWSNVAKAREHALQWIGSGAGNVRLWSIDRDQGWKKIARLRCPSGPMISLPPGQKFRLVT
jgi:hypothetical protein